MQSYDAVLIDAGTGNLHSVHNAIQKLGFNVLVTTDPADLDHPARVVLPGVGAFGSFMQGLRDRDLTEALQRSAQRGDPFLGICVGMQALFAVSEESGQHTGLALLEGRVVRFANTPGLKVPHTGWNQLWVQDGAPLFNGLSQGAYAYFNHAYYCANLQPADAAARTDYGSEFTSAVQHENIFGVQFHPEKSQAVGHAILANFLRL